MARQDIHIDATYGEVSTTDNLANKIMYDFNFIGRIDGLNNEQFIYGEVLVPENFKSRYSDASGIRTVIPYQASYKELRIRLKIELPGGGVDYIINPADNTQWFIVCRENENGQPLQFRLSEYGQLNENGTYNLLLRHGHLAIYSGDDTDFQFRSALRQNEVFLLKAMAGNLYNHPTTGVGLINFLHGNFENTGLAAKLQSEFENDKMVVNEAYMDSATGELLLDVTEING